MRKLLSTVLLSAIVLAAATAQERKNIDADDFTAVSFGVAGDLTIEQGSTFKVVLEGDEKLLDEIEVKVRDNRLLIRKPNWRRAMNKRLTVRITMPEIEGISVSGSGGVSNKGAFNCDELSLKVSGSGHIDIDELSADILDIGISGSGGVKLEGKGADKADISISGSGGVRAADFRLERVDIGVSGSGGCKLWVEKALVARVSGSGSIYYKGDPNIDARSSGSGKVKKY